MTIHLIGENDQLACSLCVSADHVQVQRLLAGNGIGAGGMRPDDGVNHLISKAFIKSVYFLTGKPNSL